MTNLSDRLYENMRKDWPYWVVVAETYDDAIGICGVIVNTEVQAKHAMDARAAAHTEFHVEDGTTFIDAVYGPYRKEAE
ncbi:hypothetical protein LCGC14_2668400 [marine sediment metagenome]|uniref:Uncharacterized protein n=1 Tax=marine sediment metagenome TaxID=412755 RepID=A0A0F8ZPX8_9ZZZZ